VVVLIGNCAIKIARFRLIRPAIRLAQLFREKRVRTQLRKYDENALMGSLKYLCAGVVANRVEYQLSREYPNAPIAEVLTMLLGGLIIIQERGEPVSIFNSQVRSHPLWAAMVEEAGNEFGAQLQFARFTPDSQVRLVDFGRPELGPMLASC